VITSRRLAINSGRQLPYTKSASALALRITRE